MLLRRFHAARTQEVILNVTPFVDILFLLIVFFILASRFVAPETFTVDIPDAVDDAQNVTSTDTTAAITLMRSSGGRVDCAIGSEIIAALDKTALVEKLSTALDHRLELLPAEKRIVSLRIDRHIPYKDVQYILAAVARSRASAVRLAALKEKRP